MTRGYERCRAAERPAVQPPRASCIRWLQNRHDLVREAVGWNGRSFGGGGIEVSYNSHRRDALDPRLPAPHRQSHVRSCAMLLGHKYRVRRSVILDLVRQSCGIDLTHPASEADLIAAVQALDQIKVEGLVAGTSDTAEPGAAPDRGGM